MDKTIYIFVHSLNSYLRDSFHMSEIQHSTRGSLYLVENLVGRQKLNKNILNYDHSKRHKI